MKAHLDINPQPVSAADFERVINKVRNSPDASEATKMTLIWFLYQTRGLSVPLWMMFRGPALGNGRKIADEVRAMNGRQGTTQLSQFIGDQILHKEQAGLQSGYGFDDEKRSDSQYAFLSFSRDDCYPPKRAPRISPDFNAISQISLNSILTVDTEVMTTRGAGSKSNIITLHLVQPLPAVQAHVG